MNRHAPHVPRTLGVLTFASAVALAALGIAGAPADTTPRARPLAGDFTGEVLPAGPVYRLPSVHVVADRSVELARIAQEERASAAGSRDCVSVPATSSADKELA